MTQAIPDSMTLGQLCRQVGLARSSVLHYETLQLLAPSGRTAAGYRRYGAAELARLRTIRRLRDAGLTLADIRALLVPPGDSAASRPVALLEKRLLELCQEAARLHAQQRLLARLLATPEFRDRRQSYDKAAWVALLRRAGFDEAAMDLWHDEFERENPAGHAAFLKSLGLEDGAIDAIRQRAQARG